MQARPSVKMLHLFVSQPHPQVLIKIVHLCCVKYSYKWVQTLLETILRVTLKIIPCFSSSILHLYVHVQHVNTHTTHIHAQELGVPLPPDHPLDSSQIEWIRMGTTVATNALLERKGERMALLITKGFRDLLYIGNQSRPNIFDLVCCQVAFFSSVH